MGLPSIVTDTNGCNEIIEDDDALYTVMKDLLINKEKRNELTLTARQNIINQYERQFVCDELLNTVIY